MEIDTSAVRHKRCELNGRLEIILIGTSTRVPNNGLRRVRSSVYCREKKSSIEPHKLDPDGAVPSPASKFAIGTELAVSVKKLPYIAVWCNGNTNDFDSFVTDSSSVTAATVGTT